ncbi:MAG: copper chaperone PCu(A)C [Ignavibacteriales bacterium]|nr:copper chaperone PCu(A)C [Ignavibacteriales bacterium]
MKSKIVFAVLFFFVLINFSTSVSQEIQNPKSKIQIHNPWVRVAAQGANTALFFVIENTGEKPDTLISAESKIADIVEVHETYAKENDMMGMREVKFVAVPSKSKVEFKPRSLHVMLIDVVKDLRIGDKIHVVLTFKHAGKIKVKAVVQEMPIMGGMKH